jgi:molybdopterin converting factor subunit 1
MMIRVLFFGLTHDLAGFDEERVELPEGGRLADLWRSYELRFPKLAEALPSLVTAVNQEIAEGSQPLRDGDEVAFLPPVSGGAPEDFCRITREAIRTEALADELKASEDGAVVVFEGIVRNHSHGRKTLYLEYEAYEPMALGKMKEIARMVKEKFAVDRVGMIHRVGRLEIGETSVAIIVTSAHRRAAFEACHFAIDRLKQIVPIWKKEFFEDGAVWAEGEGKKSEIRKQKAESEAVDGAICRSTER